MTKWSATIAKRFPKHTESFDTIHITTPAHPTTIATTHSLSLSLLRSKKAHLPFPTLFLHHSSPRHTQSLHSDRMPSAEFSSPNKHLSTPRISVSAMPPESLPNEPLRRAREQVYGRVSTSMSSPRCSTALAMGLSAHADRRVKEL
jgi:hypothetical protein